MYFCVQAAPHGSILVYFGMGIPEQEGPVIERRAGLCPSASYDHTIIYLLFLSVTLLLVHRSKAGPVDPGLGEGAIQSGQALGQGMGGGGCLGVQRPGYLKQDC